FARRVGAHTCGTGGAAAHKALRLSARGRMIMKALLASAAICFLLADMAPRIGASYDGETKPRKIMGWGTVVDPDGDCNVKGEGSKLTITVPGTLHDLFPRQADPKKRNNAPRVVQEIKGDFMVTVKVSADWKPGDRLRGAITAPYHGAGLLL